MIMSVPCSVNDFVNAFSPHTVHEKAAVFPCGDVASVELVCKTWSMLIGCLVPQIYSLR